MKKGVGVAILSGVMSACFAYGLAAGDAIKVLTLKHGTPVLWQGLPVLVVVLIGGFVTNFVWCLVQMGRYKFSSWTLHMASIIIFSSLWGIGFKEWKGSGTRAAQLLTLALLLLVGSTVIIGYGNYLGMAGTTPR